MSENSQAVVAPVEPSVRPAAEARWYCLDRDGVAMLCKDESDARAQVIENDDCWPGRAPHCAVLLGEVSAADAHIPMARLIELETAEHEREILRTNNAKLVREAHTWWTAARDAEKRAQRVPLDPLDIEEMWDEVTGMDVDDWHQEFARRIERRHGIGA